jgi:hypothetical protein
MQVDCFHTAWYAYVCRNDGSIYFSFVVLTSCLFRSGTREAAFVYAIASASVSYSVTKDCSSGNLKSCACDSSFKTRERRKRKETWHWAGCSDNVHFGNSFSKSFLDARVRERQHFSRSRIQMNLHNNEAGRRVSFHLNVFGFCFIFYYILYNQ